MGMFFLPLLVAYIIESRAKRAFLARLAPGDSAQQRRANWGGRQEWVVYAALLAASVLVCDLLVDAVHRLMGVPAAPFGFDSGWVGVRAGWVGG
jgi:hypothetical protein